MAKIILVHGSGHQASSWKKTVSFMRDKENILCPNLSSLLEGWPPSYENVYAAFVSYCSRAEGVHLCGLSLGGILALNYALDFPARVQSLVLIGTPYKVPKLAFSFQNAVFRLLPKSLFETMAFDKNGTFALGKTMKHLDFAARVHEIQCPTLILCGEKDRANLKSARFLAQNIAHAEWKVLEGAGHVLNEECPKTLAEILNAYYFLQ